MAGPGAAVLVLAAIPGELVGAGQPAPAPRASAAAGQPLAARVARLEAEQAALADWPAVAAAAEASVVTIVAGDALGSGWVVRSGRDGSRIVTNYHVVAASWEAGQASVEVHQSDQVYAAAVEKVDPLDDLALVGVAVRLPALATAPERPRLAEPVLAIGSPLGLDGSAATGVISGFRSLEGGDYLQFSAPISPGNSGGPLVDARGLVVGVTTEKAVGTGVEGLGFAIPVQTACRVLSVC